MPCCAVDSTKFAQIIELCFVKLFLCNISPILMLNRAEADSLNKSTCRAPALGVNKFKFASGVILSPFVVPLKSDLVVHKTHHSLLPL
jgi:hypothetical protein